MGRRLLGVLLVIGFAGCGSEDANGPKLYPLKGKLTVQGVPLADTMVQLFPVEPTAGTKKTAGTLAATGGTNAAGEFTMTSSNGNPGVAKGKYKVVLAYYPKMTEEELAKLTIGRKRNQGAPIQKAPFSKDYLRQDTTPKEFEMPDKASEFNFEL